MKDSWIYFALIYFIGLSKTADLQPCIDHTTKNFYINLHNKYGTQYNITQESHMLNEIMSFKAQIHEKLTRKKRNISYNAADIDVNLLQESGEEISRFKTFAEAGQIPVPHAKSIALFTHHNVDKSMVWHAIALQDNYETMGDLLKLYKYNQNQQNWILLWTEKILKSSKVYSIPDSDGTLLVITHNCMSSPSSDGVTVFHLNDNSRLQKIQSLKTCPYSDVLLWTGDYTFLAFARDHAEIRDSVLFETDSMIYVWKGKHFNFLQKFSTSNAKKMAALQIGSCHYLAVANHQNNYDEKKIFSEVFKYDAHEEKFLPFQKLASNAATDITLFSFMDGSYEESYLLIANEYIINSHRDIGSHAVIYKLENEVFVPFQSLYVVGITQWIPVVGLPGEFLILAISETSGLTIFQHDGWHFVEIPYEHDTWFENPARRTIKPYIFYGKPLLVILDPYNDGSSPNLYYALFDKLNPTQEMNSHLMSWCSKIQALSSCAGQSHHNQNKKNEQLLKVIKNYHVLESNQLQVDKNVHLNLALIGKIKTNAIYSDDINLDTTVIHKINKLYKMFDLQLSSLKSLEEIFPDAMCDDSNIYMESLNIKNLEFDCTSQPCILNDVEIFKLNNQDMAKYQKEVFYSEYIYDFYDEVSFESLTVEETFDVDKINERSIENVDLFMQELAKVAGVIVDGDVFLSSGVSVAGLLDGIKISEELILLNDADQNFEGTFSIPLIQTVLLEANQINDLSSKAIRHIVVNENKTTSSSYYLGKLTVEEAFIEGLINKIKIDSVNSNILRLSGDQDIDGITDISNMETLDVFVSASSPQSLMDSFISIKEGNFNIGQDLQFDNLITANINIEERLNSVTITEGELSLLLLDSSKIQRVTGEKMFQNVELMGPITLQGQVNSRSLERKNPVKMIEEPLILTGNFIIQGNVSIERILSCENIISEDNTQSVRHLLQRGLKLTEERILMPLFFSQPLEVRNIDCDSINGINPLSWISSQSDNMKTVSGKKTFLGGLSIQGSCAITETLNEINPTLLDRDTLKISGDQQITGKLFFANLTTKGLNCQNISFGTQPFESLLTVSRDLAITGEVNIIGNTAIHEGLSAYQIDVTGSTAGFDINDLFNDTIMMSSKRSEINGNIVFQEPLTIKSLDLYGMSGVNIQKLLSSENWNKEILFDEPLYINKSIAIRNITFDLSIAGISKNDFGYSWLLTEDSQVFHGNQYFTEIICDGGIYVETGKINSYDISYIYSNIIWLDQNAFFTKAEFKNGLCIYNTLKVDGFLNNLIIPQDLIIKRKYTGDEQIVLGHKRIRKNLYISGSLETDYISNVNLPYLCQITLSVQDVPVSGLYIDGSLKFYKEPDITKLNDVNIAEIMSTMWLSDEPAILYGINFIAKVTLENTATVQGSVGGIDLHGLSENFISLTDDQVITNLLEISKIHCDKIKVYKTSVGNHVNGFAFDLFYNNTLKVDGYQIVDKYINFETVCVKEYFELDGKVNNLNLQSDVFRFSSENHNIKHMTLNAANIKSLTMLKGSLQNVDIVHYFKNVIDKTMLHSSVVRGAKTINNCTSSDISVSGLLNGKKIIEENILSRVIPQTVTGRKTIASKDVTYFQSAKISKNINKYNAYDIFTSLIKKDGEEVIIQSPKIIESQIYSDNLFVDGSVNGINFSILAKSLKNPKLFNNYDKEYTELINYSHQIAANFEKPARKLTDMKTVHVISPGQILSITSIPQTLEVVKTQIAIAFRNPAGLSEIQFYSWNEHQHIFEQNLDMKPLVYYEYITKIFSFTLGSQLVLFVEIYDAQAGYKILLVPFDERFMQFDENSHNRLDSNVTLTAVSLESTDQNCLFVSSMFGSSQLFCHGEHASVNDLRWRQSVTVFNSTEVTVLNISGVVHVLAANIESVQILRLVGTGRGTLATLQSLPGASSLAAASLGHHHFAAALHDGIITIYKFNSDVQRFEKHQDVYDVDGAQRLQLIILPGQQLTLIILDAQARLVVYADAGILGFQWALIHYTYVTQVDKLISIPTPNGQHFTAILSDNKVHIVETILK